jgi:hypothetical protein
MELNHHRIAKVSNTRKRRSRSFVIYCTSPSFCSKYLGFFLLLYKKEHMIRSSNGSDHQDECLLRCNAIWSGRHVPICNLTWRHCPEDSTLCTRTCIKLSVDKIPLLQHSGGGGYGCFVELNSTFHKTLQVSSDVLSYCA